MHTGGITMAEEKMDKNSLAAESSGSCAAMPLIGDRAPAFRSMTTMGKCNFPEDYKGKWVVFVSHPADFTPVCTTEFIALARRAEEFHAINTELLGLSIDSLHSHLAWAESIEHIDLDGKGKVEIPSVASTQTVRAVFIIDPDSIIRAILFYPMSTGRNIDEIKRILLSLQKHDAENISTPADWNPGSDVVLPAPLTLEIAKGRLADSDQALKKYSWYLTMKKES